jgi:hypothetical protein
MSSLELRIDDLYKGPFSDFVPARTRLAKALAGADARRVKALKKPTVVPWAVNQVYWHARPVYDRLVTNGAALRREEVAAVSGRSANVRSATESHHKALVAAVAEAARLASRAEVHPSGEALARMLEAVSLRPDLPEPPGRLVTTLAPRGFEALAGIAFKPVAQGGSAPPVPAPSRPAPASKVATPRIVEDAHRREREQAVAERRKRTAIQKAETAVRRATAAETRTREAWERAKEERQKAANHLAALRAT